MLGALMAIAMGKMPNLEEFCWNSLSGIRPDVWLALSVLSNRDNCRLERVWVRCGGMTKYRLPITFSTLPSLKSLSVLNIDHFSCVEELCTAIGKSYDKLQELRIGLSINSSEYEPWARPLNRRRSVEDDKGHYHSEGILGALFSQLRRKANTPLQSDISSPASYDAFDDKSADTVQKFEDQSLSPAVPSKADQGGLRMSPHQIPSGSEPCLLSLRVLELEQVFLSTSALHGAVDWCKLKSLTLLRCLDTQQLWASLWQRYSPSATVQGSSSALGSSVEYKLQLTHIYTDEVSQEFLRFVKDTLAPGTLETLLLPHSCYSSISPFGELWEYAVQRHQESLTKLLIAGGQCTGVYVTGDQVRSLKHMRLRELSLTLSETWWKDFLQSLGEMPTLRALQLHLPDVVQRSEEWAEEIVDVVTLRPDFQLRWLSIDGYYYEIVESSDGDLDNSSQRRPQQSQPPNNTEPAAKRRKLVPYDRNKSALKLTKWASIFEASRVSL